MTRLLHRSADWYRVLLRLCPEDLRHEFESEIVLAFSEELAASWQHAGVPGLIRVWRSALADVLRVALPQLAFRPGVIVPVACFALSVCALGGELALARMHAPGAAGSIPLASAVQIVVLLPSIVAAFTSSIAIRMAGRKTAVSLGV